MSERPKPGGTRALVIAALKASVLLAFLGGTTWAVAYYHREIWGLLSHRHQFREWILSWGGWAPVVFIVLQIAQIVIFVIPGEVVQAAGGWLFGPWMGALYGVAGALVGAALAFLIADWLGRPLVKIFVKPEQFQRLEQKLNGRGGLATVFVLFLIPGTPKDTLCYVAGLTPIHFGWFVALSTLARIPGILLCTFLGDSVHERHYHEFIGLCIVGLVALVLGILFRKRIESWIERKHPADQPAQGKDTDTPVSDGPEL